MIIPYDPQNSREAYRQYYSAQQRGNGMSVYSGKTTMKGHGIGSIFSGLARSVLPMLGKTVGKTLLNAGVGTVKSLVGGKSFKESIKSQLKPLGFNLLDDVGTIIGGVKKWRTNKTKGQTVQAVTRKRKAHPPRRNPIKKPIKKRKVKKSPQSGANNIFY